MFAATALVSFANGGELTAYSMLTRDGRRLVSRTEDGKSVFSLVPTNGLPRSLPPVRPWKIYGVKSTHTDIGLHNSQYVQRQESVLRLEEALRLVDTDRRRDDDPAAYRYVVEGGWCWENYPMDRGESAACNVVSNYIRRGRIGIGCTCAGNHTQVYGPEELIRSTIVRRHLVDKWGIDSRTMLMCDNPGISWSIVRPYAAAGIEHVLFSPNQWNPVPSTLHRRDDTKDGATWNPDAGGGGNYIDVRWDSERPMLFWWESPDRSARLLVWCSTMYDYGLSAFGVRPWGAALPLPEVERHTALQLQKMERRYPYDVWLAANYGDDEPANRAYADFCAAWNEKWATPQFMTVGNLDEPFDEVKSRWGNQIPTVRGEMTSGWLQHVVSAPELLAEKLEAERKLAVADTLVRRRGERRGSDARAVDRAWWSLIQYDEHSYGTSGYQGRRVFETWMQKRDWLRQAGETADRILSSEGVRVSEESAVVVDGEAENAFYRIRTNDRGEILSIFDKELQRELLKGTAGRLLYTRDNHRTWSDERLLGAKITRCVTLPKDAKRIDVEIRIEHATDLFNDDRYRRYGYVAFPFDVTNGVFRAALGGGEVIDPYQDQSGYATDSYVAARDWCAVENGAFGVALLQRDTLLVEFGEIHPDKTCFTGRAPQGKSTIYSYAFADWLQMHQPDGASMNFTFRYAMTSYRGSWREADVPTRADAFVNPWRGAAGLSREVPKDAGGFAEPVDADGWTGLLSKPCAGHGERDGQIYLLWPADLSPDLVRYDVFRDGAFRASVTNEAPGGLPYRVARFVDLGLGTHSRHTYRVRPVYRREGREVPGGLSDPFVGLTREVSEAEQTRVVVNDEDARLAVRYDGAQVESWRPVLGEEVFFMQERPQPGEEVHGGVPICWPWFGKPEREGLPKHGLARYLRWRLAERIGKTTLVLVAESTPETRRLWPHDFRLTCRVSSKGNHTLKIVFMEENTGTTTFSRTWGFHPYLAVSSALKISVCGEVCPKPPCLFSSKADGRSRELRDLVSGRVVRIACSDNTDWLVWNPGVERTPLCKTLGPDEWQRFCCLEPCSLTPEDIRPGERRTHELTITLSE